MMNHEKSTTATLMSRASHLELMRIFSAKHGRSRTRVRRVSTVAEKCAGAEEAGRVGGSADKPAGWCGARVCG